MKANSEGRQILGIALKLCQ